MASASAELRGESATGAEVYVGPRPFETGENLYGRNREASELLSLLIAERIVLLHSPSGAGKTSVVQALLLPEIHEEGFFFPKSADEQRRGKPLVIRVNTPPPADAPPECNRYALSVLLSLEEHRPEADRRAPALLTGMELDAYLRAEFAVPPAGSSKPPPLLLVFDQFEEVLTLDPTDRPAKEAFFQQLGTALRDRTRWALFASRDDFVAALEPYRHHIPTGLNVTYRLDFLSERSARDAIVKPAEEANAKFEPELVAKLLRELRLVRVMQPEGTFLEEVGPSVEPVYLQVVCRRLWKVRRDPKQVTLADLEAIKGEQGVGVDVVLAEYYAETVKDAAEKSKIEERVVREWFGRKLILAGTRRPVLKGDELQDGINEDCLRVLDKAFLIRSEPRGGAFWYELAHDRLIGPVLKNNERWRHDHLNRFQRQAELWDQGKRPDGLLVRGELLEEGERWDATTPEGKKTQAEKDFLKKCREVIQNEAEATRQEQEKGRFRRKMTILGAAVALLGCLILAMFLVITSLRQQRDFTRKELDLSKKETAFQELETSRLEAEQKVEIQLRKKAQLQERVLQTQTKNQPNRHSAVADALEVMKEAAAEKETIDSPAAEGLLRSAMAGIGWEELPMPRKPLACAQGNSAPHARPEENPVTAAEFSPMGKWLAVGRRDGAVVVWAMDSRGGLSRKPLTRNGNCTNGRSAEVSALSFGPDDSDLAIAFGDGRFVIVNPNAPETDLQPQPPKLHESAIREIVFSSDSKWFATVALDGTSLLWARKGVQKIMDLSTIGHSVVTSLTFTPFPRRMHFGTTDGEIHSLNLLSSPPTLDAPRLIAKDVANKPVAALAVHPSARMTAIAWSGGYTGFRTLSMDPNSKMVHEVIEVIGTASTGTQDERAPRVSSVASLEFSDDGRWLVSRTRDHQMQLWAVTNDFRLRYLETFPEPGLPLESVQFGSIQGILRRTRWLLGEVGDGTVLLWDLLAPRNVPLALRGHKGPLTVACFDPRGRWLLTSCFDGTNRLWDLERLEDPGRSVEPRVVLDDAPVLAGRFSTVRSQHLFATITSRGKLRAWELDHSKDQTILVPESRPPIDPVYRPRVAFSGDGNLLFLTVATYLGDPPLSKVWRPGDPETRDRPIPFRTMFPEQGSKRPEEQFFHSRYELGADGRFLAGFDLEDNPVVVDLLAPNKADRLQIPVSHATAQGDSALGFSPDGHQLMMAQQDIGVKLWNLQFPEGKAVLSGEARFPWQTPEKPLPGAAADETSKGNETSDITSVAVSNDGKLMAAAGQGVVWVWERSSTSTFAPPIVLRGHTGAVSALAFTPDGEKLISGSDDSTVRVWHLKPTPKVDAFVPLLGHRGPITSASISPDGKLLLTTSLDGTARVWTLNSEMLIERAEQMTREPEMARVRARY